MEALENLLPQAYQRKQPHARKSRVIGQMCQKYTKRSKRVGFALFYIICFIWRRKEKKKRILYTPTTTYDQYTHIGIK